MLELYFRNNTSRRTVFDIRTFDDGRQKRTAKIRYENGTTTEIRAEIYSSADTVFACYFCFKYKGFFYFFPVYSFTCWAPRLFPLGCLDSACLPSLVFYIIVICITHVVNNLKSKSVCTPTENLTIFSLRSRPPSRQHNSGE